ncbi:hypothetical protein HU200_007156 [Digitaria exilis]|uniref:Uncharacterized protein n=1 Tax=Digitaria exilis TaxID=1010633 RepID=A0A835KUK5_9POAL|nr:hypothetical protein HU200_007156 [Digitaria exilis]
MLARSLCPFLLHQPASTAGPRCGSKRGHVLASRQLSRLWLDVRNGLAICRAWVQLFCNGDGWETYGMDGR